MHNFEASYQRQTGPIEEQYPILRRPSTLLRASGSSLSVCHKIRRQFADKELGTYRIESNRFIFSHPGLT